MARQWTKTSGAALAQMPNPGRLESSFDPAMLKRGVLAAASGAQAFRSVHTVIADAGYEGRDELARFFKWRHGWRPRVARRLQRAFKEVTGLADLDRGARCARSSFWPKT